jgi:hypothetical protein
MTTALEGASDQQYAPAVIYLRERPSTHCARGWVVPRAGLDRCRKSRPPPGFDPQTVQPVVSRYTDWAPRPMYIYVYMKRFCPKAPLGQLHSPHKLLTVSHLANAQCCICMVVKLVKHCVLCLIRVDMKRESTGSLDNTTQDAFIVCRNTQWWVVPTAGATVCHLLSKFW